MKKLFWTGILAFCALVGEAQNSLRTDVLVVGGGTGGTAAGIQSARMGVKTLVVEEGPWLGGMISAAGVTCTDGNHNLPSGIWNEFRNHIYKTYGGPKAVATGWVSHTNFEPHVSDSIWKHMAKAEKLLTVRHGWRFQKALMKNGAVAGAVFTNARKATLTVQATITIDATEMGDLLASAKVPYSLGMEAGARTDERVGVNEDNNIVQDLTYVAILKNYGTKADCTIAKPRGYRPEEFDGACTDYYQHKNIKAPTVDAAKMLDYGRIPNGKYMINWPNQGNDTYLNVVEMSPAQRDSALEAAKQTTLRFVYFIQQQLGFRHLGLADDEFPTPDRLAIMPYYREGRRVQGLVRFTIRHIAEPFSYGDPLYRTGISVGDYPIDHHHKKNPEAPQHLDFHPIPSYSLPLGTIIPAKAKGLIVAEKGISVSNVVNGTTRLQPIVMLTGQAAGALAAICVKTSRQPAEVPVRKLQQSLLEAGAYLMPYYDVTPNHPQFLAIQKIGATGILKGKGVPYQWANQTWFYPDSTVSAAVFAEGFKPFTTQPLPSHEKPLTVEEAIKAIYQSNALTRAFSGQNGKPALSSFMDQVQANWTGWKLNNFQDNRAITRAELARLLQETMDPFQRKPVNHKGEFM